MSGESWPPALKEWVSKCLAQMSDTNRTLAQEELRKVIADSFAAKTLWTTDWAGMHLQSLAPKVAVPSFNQLKRKMNEPTPPVKKVKKASAVSKNIANTLGPTDRAALQNRAARFSREHEIERQKQNGSLRANDRHAHLFEGPNRPRSPADMLAFANDVNADPNVIDWDRYTIVGTNQEVLKDYLRLTAEPKPEQVRPYSVLQRTLLELKRTWKMKSEKSAKERYPWICSQLKSLRQDLTVQRIKNEFTVNVYEIHARMALESGDLVEYQQCQATLKMLYELGIPGKVEEFISYRILTLMLGRNKSELNLFVGQLTEEQKLDPAVSHALKVQRAMSMGNYHALFVLYLSAPHTTNSMGVYIMDHFIARERIKALMVMTKAYQRLPLIFVQAELAFETVALAREFLIDHSAAFFKNPNEPDDQKTIDCKPAEAQLLQVFEEKYRKVLIKGVI